MKKYKCSDAILTVPFEMMDKKVIKEDNIVYFKDELTSATTAKQRQNIQKKFNKL